MWHVVCFDILEKVLESSRCWNLCTRNSIHPTLCITTENDTWSWKSSRTGHSPSSQTLLHSETPWLYWRNVLKVSISTLCLSISPEPPQDTSLALCSTSEHPRFFIHPRITLRHSVSRLFPLLKKHRATVLEVRRLS